MKHLFLPVLILLSIFGGLFAQSTTDFQGDWELIRHQSSDIALYRTMSLSIAIDGDDLTLTQRWGGKRSLNETIELKINGKAKKIEVTNRVFPTNVFMALQMPVGKKKKVAARWDGESLLIHESYKIHGSQGYSPVECTHNYTLNAEGELVYTVSRSTRETGPEIKYLLKRKGTKKAWFMHITDEWRVKDGLDQQAMLIGLQGLANRGGPSLYFIYPETWQFNYTSPVFDYYSQQRNYTFAELKSPEQAIKTFRDKLKGYVVWDKDVRTSLTVSFTVAGLEDALVVSEDLIPLAEAAGLNKIEDFRGKFTGQNDAQIYQWAYDQYWVRCNKELIVWMGGHSGAIMKPGVADWGINQKVFFTDLSSRPTDTEEYALASRLLGEMKPYSLVMGWHSYAKDKEREHVTLTSSYTHTVEGLHNLPNLSFSSQIPFSKTFKIKNNHNVVPGKKYIPEEKVYITCVQTDGLGIGSWTKPGRGEIPYAWEFIMNYSWLAPGMMEFFYSTATPNDYFIGALSGPGYMYPKAVPADKLPHQIQRAAKLLKELDLNVFEVMDYSEGATVEGNTELTEEIVDAYYENMPDVIGFLNGYAPAYTFTSKDGRPMISYDYYLSPERTEADAAADLTELGKINKLRPYFLLMHIRETSDVKRVKGILDRLPEDYEVVPLDIFLKMAGEKPTFEEYFLEK